MKILVVTQYFWPENFRINDLVLGLMEHGHAVTVLTGKPNYPSGKFFTGYGFLGRWREKYHGADVRRVPLSPRGKGGGLRLFFNYVSFAVAATMLGPFLCRDKYDIILVYEPSPITVGLPALWFKKLRGVPVFLWVQDLWPESLSATRAVRSAWVLRQVERLVRIIYTNCDRILVQSKAFFRPIEALGVEPARIVYFPNSAEPLYQPMKSSSADRAQADVPDGFVVMFAGNIGVAQDFATIIQAAELLQSHARIQWVVVGDGRMRPWLEVQVKARGLSSNVHLLGKRPIETMPHLFSMADAMLVTLKKDPIFTFTIPSKVQSYLACGRPIVASLDGEGARVVQEAGAGLSVPAEDAAALANAVLAMSQMDREQREAMGGSGRSYFERNFQRDMLLERLDGWLHETLQRGSACAS